jgi:RNA polymerase sigma-70 factor (ECF subfamily)
MTAHLATARPRVIAALNRSFRDIDLAQDGFQEASLRALGTWDRDGLPDSPTAWLIRCGRNAIIDKLRKLGRELPLKDEHLDASTDHPENRLVEAIDRDELRDDVLRLFFMCCHPDLPTRDQLALALKVIAGFTTDKIARAFVIRTRTMEQRITRAKAKAASIAARLETPTAQERGERLEAVSTLVYLLFNEGYSAGGGDIHIRTEVCDEAVRLARLLLDLFPSQPELMGLLALCLLQHSRRRARVDNAGQLVSLDDQNREEWDQELITEGKVLVEKALRKGSPGPFQVQAAIAAVHCSAGTATDTDWSEIERLYELLERIQPSPVVSLNRAVAIARNHGSERALEMIEPLGESLSDYLYYHTARAGLLAQAGQTRKAALAYRRALDLGPTNAEAEYLKAKLAALKAPS